MNLIEFKPKDLHNMTTWFSIAFGKKDNSLESDDITNAKIIGLLASEMDQHREKERKF